MVFLTTTTLFAVGVLLVFYALHRRHKRAKLPPGPPRLPLIGNLHQAPQVRPWVTYQKWVEEYGPIVSADFGGTTVVILGDYEVARDLLDKRGNIYSSRPRMVCPPSERHCYIILTDSVSQVMAPELVCRNKNMLFKQYTPDFLLHQRMSASVLSPRASACYTPIQDLESKALLHKLLVAASANAGGVVPEFANIFETMTASIVYSTTFGLRIITGQEWQLKTSHECVKNIVKAGQVGAWIVDALPWLNLLPRPLAPWKKIADAWHDKWDNLHMTNYHDALQRPGWNWAKCFSHSKEVGQMSETEVAWNLGILCDAGVETTNTQLQIFILACCAWPEWVPWAQKELDRVVGKDRLPTFEDLDKLPYIHAIVEECFRWRHLAPTGIPHATTLDDWYKGYFIPKGSLVIFLAIAMRNNKELYEDPEVFRPERWLDTKHPEHMPNPQNGNWGYGRRVCPGRFIAQKSLIIAIARMLWAFDIGSEDGKPIAVDESSFTPGFVSGPRPFKAKFALRDEHRRAVIEREFESAEKDVGRLMDEVRRRQVAVGLKH